MTFDADLLFDGQIYERVVREGMRSARQSLLIATALVKQTNVEMERGEHGPFLRLANDLIGRGVRVALLLAGRPTRPFLESLRDAPLAQQRLAVRLCARNHMKIVIRDGKELYAGSANLTGAGLGHKSVNKRNFEFGLYTKDPRLVLRFSQVAEQIWVKAPCHTCEAKRLCAAEHNKVQEALNTCGVSLQAWEWPRDVRVLAERLARGEPVTKRRNEHGAPIR